MGNAFLSTLGVSRGQQIEQGLAQAEREGIELRDVLAKKKAFAAHGQNKFFSGYEGDPRAIRPQEVRDLYESDPDAAMKLEDRLSTTLGLERAARQAGNIEFAKKTGDYSAAVNAFPTFFGPDSGGAVNAFARDEMPSSPSVGEPQATPAGMPPQPTSNLYGLSGTTKKVKIGPMGPEISAEQLSPFDRGNQIEQRDVERKKLSLQQDTERRAAMQEAHDNVQAVEKEIQSVRKDVETRAVPHAEGVATIQQLQREKAALEQHRDALAGGRAPIQNAPASTDEMPATPAPIVPRRTAPAPPVSAAPRFTEKEQADLDMADRREKMTAANKEITNARLNVEKVTKFLPSIKELHRLVTKENIGHPELEAIPGSAAALSLNRTNAQVKKLNEAIVNMFAEPGQSQMMNTIVERQMQGAVVPGLFTEPQLNKINSSILMSNVEHLRNFPTFLEKWQKQHKGELTGAADAWIDYTDHNPRYGYKKDVRGNVTVHENKNVIAPETWQYLRDHNMVRSIGDKTFVKQKDGSWEEK